jgi:hypothetical protein
VRELLICDGCGHQADGVKDLIVLDSFAFAGADTTADVDILLVECRCGDRAELSVPAAA